MPPNNVFALALRWKEVAKRFFRILRTLIPREECKPYACFPVITCQILPRRSRRGRGDGVTYTHDNPDKPGKVIVQVKGGQVGSPVVSQLHGTMSKEKAVMGFLICLEKPTPQMTLDAAKFGYYTPRVGKQVPVIQIRTVEELLDGKGFDGPLSGGIGAYKDAPRIAGRSGQKALFGEE